MANKRIRCLLIGIVVVLPLIKAVAAEPLASFVNAARTQIGKTVRYDPTYYTLSYPNGDMPIEGGVCTDVVVRALRSSLNMDLQKLVHDDMQRAFTRYPKHWGLKSTDKNIDHRRVLNLQTYFKREGYELPISSKAEDYQAGDLVTVLLPANLPHIMIVSDKTAPTSHTPLIIHNIGNGTQEEDRLFEFKITGHYRIKP
ncbi:MAG: DUF1287 domain-containing protein [Methylococcaceae bacterium]|nr:DUF1287 domain-containing protein [Methylococcaceae bacterium]MDD1615239.1 DUF1287 domain-containing protein [Methylococcaceae bacterium]OYV20897.1 MAG: hypothetical protein CG439_298 [Methylococcaceae bacterium NSP1-2]